MLHLVLTGGDLLDGFTPCGYTRRYLMHLLRVDGGGDGRFRYYVLWRSLHSTCQSLLGCLAVRSPSQDGCNTNKRGEYVARKAFRALPFRLLF